MNELSGKEFKLSSAQVSSNVADEVVILNHDKGVYYGLGEVGATLWSALESGPKSFDELCAVVTAEYEVDRETCEADVAALLSELMHEKLVEADS
ncbi:PqqD family peptide modification chaperone [Persicitalea jodogahamensis]|uniref:PqqD family protein n=1 Tax=Persicitalea jodogahamensis TaxID=402147 RepID=A0A8J3D1F6_9BACT|nr:PqqD family peptide modification chaperone [Persicitalea jodogahamensis]GHB56385.1 hypothetical protein GCM10007390_07150 [Persicitalea jodogahamensis]